MRKGLFLFALLILCSSENTFAERGRFIQSILPGRSCGPAPISFAPANSRNYAPGSCSPAVNYGPSYTYGQSCNSGSRSVTSPYASNPYATRFFVSGVEVSQAQYYAYLQGGQLSPGSQFSPGQPNQQPTDRFFGNPERTPANPPTTTPGRRLDTGATPVPQN